MTSIELVVAAIIVVGLILTAAAVTVSYFKLSAAVDRLSKQVVVDIDNAVQQVESLLCLHHELKLSHGLPPTRGWAASPDFLRNLMRHALEQRPGVILECSSGVSTVVLARCAQLCGSGHVHSLEHDAKYAEVTRRELDRQGLTQFATVYHAPLEALTITGWSGQWYRTSVLPQLSAIDMIVVDGPPWHTGELPRYPALPVFYDAMRDGASLFLDDANRPAETEIVKRWTAMFPGARLTQGPACEKGCVHIVKSQA